MEIIGKFWKIALLGLSSLFLVLLVGRMYATDSDLWMKLAPQERKSTAAIKKFITQYDSGRYKYIVTGQFPPLPPETDYGIWVTAKTDETVKSGRENAVKFLQDYLKEIQANKETTKYFEYNCIARPSKYSGKISLKNVGFRIAYWNDQVERPKAPFLSEIDFYDNTFRYYEADPKTQALKLVLEESYEKALDSLKDSKKGND